MTAAGDKAAGVPSMHVHIRIGEYFAGKLSEIIANQSDDLRIEFHGRNMFHVVIKGLQDPGTAARTHNQDICRPAYMIRQGRGHLIEICNLFIISIVMSDRGQAVPV